MKRIMCYGDSNTWGHDPNTLNPETGMYCRYPEHVRWPSILRDELGEDYMVFEEGLCGRTTVFDDPAHYGWNGLTHLEVALRTCDPLDCVVLMLGTNDTKDVFHASSYFISTGMERLVRTCRDVLANSNSRNAKIILAAPLKVVRSGDGSYWYDFTEESTQKLEDLRKLYRELADMLGCVFFDANDYGHADPADGVHMDPAGHRAVADAMASLIREILK